jgi:hypothetical protein
MIRFTVQVVNAGLTGEPDDIVFQNDRTMQIFRPEEVYKVVENGELREPSIPDDVWRVIREMNQRCFGYIDENQNFVLYFE